MPSAPGANILVIRLGAMGDILHTLPAAASLKLSFPQARISWLVARKWMPLLEGNPYLDELIPFERAGFGGLIGTWQRLRAIGQPVAFDFQGLVQSAVAGRAARPRVLYGFTRAVAREPLAAALYTDPIAVTGPHRIERSLQLIQAAGAANLTHETWLPKGSEESGLPKNPFVLASPFAGWASKQWPIERYEQLAALLKSSGMPLVVNVPENRAKELAARENLRVHVSSIQGLIGATRRATAVVGLDSGPLHLAAALRKPGVALFGPTDPKQTGPFGGTMQVLRPESAETTYKRHDTLHPGLSQISAEEVADAVLRSVAAAAGSEVASAGTIHGL